MKALVVLSALVLVFMALAAYNWFGQPGLALIPQASGERDTEVAPDFSIVVYQGAEVLGGPEVRFADLPAQGQPVVLNFWAGQCPPCRVEMPHLQEVSEDYLGRILVFGLDVGPFVGLGPRQDGQALLNDLDVTFPAGTTFDAQVVRDYQILGMPTTLFITPDGRVARKWSGLLTKDKLVELVEELLEQS